MNIIQNASASNARLELCFVKMTSSYSVQVTSTMKGINLHSYTMWLVAFYALGEQIRLFIHVVCADNAQENLRFKIFSRSCIC